MLAVLESNPIFNESDIVLFMRDVIKVFTGTVSLSELPTIDSDLSFIDSSKTQSNWTLHLEILSTKDSGGTWVLKSNITESSTKIKFLVITASRTEANTYTVVGRIGKGYTTALVNGSQVSNPTVTGFSSNSTKHIVIGNRAKFTVGASPIHALLGIRTGPGAEHLEFLATETSKNDDEFLDHNGALPYVMMRSSTYTQSNRFNNNLAKLFDFSVLSSKGVAILPSSLIPTTNCYHVALLELLCTNPSVTTIHTMENGTPRQSANYSDPLANSKNGILVRPHVSFFGTTIRMQSTLAPLWFCKAENFGALDGVLTKTPTNKYIKLDSFFAIEVG